MIVIRDKFQSNLRAVLGFIKYSNDSDALGAFLSKESSLHDLDVEAARVIGVCTNTEFVLMASLLLRIRSIISLETVTLPSGGFCFLRSLLP